MKSLDPTMQRPRLFRGLAMGALLAASCGGGDGGGGLGTGEGGASGIVGEGGLAQGSGGIVGEGGLAQGSGGSVGAGGVLQGNGGSAGVSTGGVVGGAGGNLGTTLDGGQDGVACSLGADPVDCQLCQGDIPASCERPCPKVDCSVYPPPAECEAVCGGATCCECQRSFGNEYFWRAPLMPITCGTACSDMIARWKDLLSAPSITACAVDADCIAVGGGGSCDCVASLSGCGKAVNSAAYQVSGAADIVGPFLRDCKNATRACDCGMPSVGCRSGQCAITGYRGCGSGIDASPPRG